MSMSLGDHSSAPRTIPFVKGGEHLVAPKRRKKGNVNTAHGSAAFTGEESSSFYGNLVGLPSNVRLRTLSLSAVDSSCASENSNHWGAATGGDGESRRDPSSSVPPNNLSESNVGFQLLKKSGWKEGTGLGAAEQGRLDPVEAPLKQDRRGIGAELKKKKRLISGSEERRIQREGESDDEKDKGLSKKARKARAKAEQEQEQALAKAFFREFWPENV